MLQKRDDGENNYGKDMVDTPEIFATLDALPAALRRRIDYARINLFAGPYLESLSLGWSQREVLAMIEEDEAEFIRRHAIEAYGHSHPDARFVQRRGARL